MKRLVVLLVCVCLVFSSLSVPALATSTDGTIVGGSVYGCPGEVVNLPISFRGNPGFWIMYLTVHYDSTVFEYIGTDNGDYRGLYNETVVRGEFLKLCLSGTSYADLTGDGIIQYLKVKIRDNAKPGRYGFALSIDPGMASSYDEKYVVPDFLGGSISVLCKEHSLDANGVCSACGASVVDSAVTPDSTIKPIVPSGARNTEFNDEAAVASVKTKDDEERAATEERLAIEKAENTAKLKAQLRRQKLNKMMPFFIAGGVLLMAAVAVVVTLLLKGRKKKSQGESVEAIGLATQNGVTPDEAVPSESVTPKETKPVSSEETVDETSAE